MYTTGDFIPPPNFNLLIYACVPPKYLLTIGFNRFSFDKVSYKSIIRSVYII